MTQAQFRHNFAISYLRFLCLLLPLQLAFCVWMGVFRELPLVHRLPLPVAEATTVNSVNFAAIYHYVETDFIAQLTAFEAAQNNRKVHQGLIGLCLAAFALVLYGLARPNPMTAPGLIIASFLLMVAISINSQYGVFSLVLNGCFFLPALWSALHFKKDHVRRLEEAGDSAPATAPLNP